jgi:hypothetical protein
MVAPTGPRNGGRRRQQQVRFVDADQLAAIDAPAAAHIAARMRLKAVSRVSSGPR